MSGKKILITGADGMFGSGLMDSLGYEGLVGCGRDFDITDLALVTDRLNQEQPNIIIHTAAYTDVEACEKDADKAYAVNTTGVQNLVDYCVGKEVLFIYVSSTGVYGSHKNGAYIELDAVDPTTVHHKSKYESEKIVQSHLDKYLILRAGWLYGGGRAHSKNFVYKRFLEASGKDKIYSDDSQIGNPTYVIDLIEQIKILIEHQQTGVFNCVNKAVNISRYDYVQKIVELFGIKCKVVVAPEGMFNRVAPVSHNESAINKKLDLLGLNVMGEWSEALSRYVHKLKNEV